MRTFPGSARGGADAVAGPTPGTPQPTPIPTPAALPAALLGDWYMVGTGNTNDYNPTTGAWSSPSGKGNTWQFTADGRYTHAFLYQVSFYGCLTRVFFWDEGSVAESGGTITLRSDRATIKSESSCNATDNYERPFDGASGTAAYTLSASAGRPVLAIAFTSNATETFVRP